MEEFSIFNKEKALQMIDEDAELLKILIDTFLEIPFDKNHLQKLVQNKKDLEAASYVHAVKGAARQLAAEKLAHSGQELEDILRKKKDGDTNKLIELFTADYNKTFETLKASV